MPSIPSLHELIQLHFEAKYPKQWVYTIFGGEVMQVRLEVDRSGDKPAISVMPYFQDGVIYCRVASGIAWWQPPVHLPSPSDPKYFEVIDEVTKRGMRNAENFRGPKGLRKQ